MEHNRGREGGASDNMRNNGKREGVWGQATECSTIEGGRLVASNNTELKGGWGKVTTRVTMEGRWGQAPIQRTTEEGRVRAGHNMEDNGRREVSGGRQHRHGKAGSWGRATHTREGDDGGKQHR